MSDPLMPNDIVQWINARNWGQHHEEWHAVRQWDLQTPQVQNWMISQGWQRADKQEGAAGNGFDFLIMHRAMLQLLRQAFPANASLLQGWITPPTNPLDPNDPLPNQATTPFDPNMTAAIAKIQAPPPEWQTDDDFGLFVETTLRPLAGNPFHTSPDPTTGLHNYLHNRFADDNSPVDMGSPRLNLGNQRFWRLHGWIDTQWSVFRAARGLLDTDSVYQAALQAERDHMAGMPGMTMETMGAAAQAAVAAMPPVPHSVSHPFELTLSKEFATLSANVPKVQSINDLELLLQLALKVEHFTIPLYLTAMWSVKGTTGSAPFMRGILREVVRQEMLHMGIVCNLLIGIGRKPQIIESVPTYPDFLPGVDIPHPISLEKLSLAQVKVFREIELPEFPPIDIPVLETLGPAKLPKFKTIGDLYSVISDGLTYLEQQGKLSTLTTTGQLTDTFGVPGSLDVYATVALAKAAIDLVRGQGEGRPESPTQPGPGSGPDPGNLAHYYLFGQIVDARQYVKQPNGSFAQDPNKPLPFPPPTDIFDMAPVPAGGYPKISDAFDLAYSEIVRTLDSAWNGSGGPDALSTAHEQMMELRIPAVALMGKPRQPPFGPGNFAPSFRYLSEPPGTTSGASKSTAGAPPVVKSGLGVAPPPTTGGPKASSPADYTRVQQILDAAVHGDMIGAHGPFWRTLDRNGFVAKAVFGRPLLAKNPDGSFNPSDSNLIKALEGRAPFDGSVLDRMPVGYDPVPQAPIDEIRAWIAAGCPAAVAGASPALQLLGATTSSTPPSIVDLTAGGPQPGDVHNAFWRNLDAWSMNSATQATMQDVLSFMDLARFTWLAFAQDPTQLAGWLAAIRQADMAASISRLEQAQRNSVTATYGLPVAFLSLLDGFEKFGRDELPNDPLHGSDPRHRMDGRTQWFVWGAFADACLRLGAPIPSDFWSAMLRAILDGLINDGLFRDRFPVQGFTKNAAGAAAINVFARSLRDDQLQAELVRRFTDSGLPGI